MSDAKARPSGQRAALGGRGAARLAAVQALYQVEMSGRSASAVSDEFLIHRAGRAGPDAVEEGGVLDGLDREWFTALVRGVAADDSLDDILAGALAEGWTVERLDPVLRAILRAGLWELLHRPDVPGAVVANEYVELANGFFADKEPAVVNAILDRVSGVIRDPEADGST